MKKIYQKTKSILFLVLCTTTLYAQNYYVSPGGSDSNNGLTNTTPFKSISKAAGLVTPGNTVFLMKGVYAQGYVVISKSGSPGKYITYIAYPGDNPKITFTGSIWNLILITASYIVFDGIELEGNNANLTYSGALASYNDKNAGGNNTALYGQYNTNAISVNGDVSKGIFPTHVTIRNCIVHDFSAGGIGSGLSDYITVENNIVYNNSWYTMYACSGISIINPYNTDNVTTYKIIVRNNICHNNKTLIPWIGITPHRLSDGNGIIIDVNQRTPTPTNSAGVPYVGRTLVENNVSYYNGGSGIHAFSADHVDIINNSAFHNGVIMGYADIYGAYANDVKIFNNIMYSETGGKCNSNNNNTNVTYDYNIYFNGAVAVQGVHDIVGKDPQYIDTSASGRNFQLKNTSPAINSGSAVAGQFSATDIKGVTRDSKPDRGAYEYLISTEVIPINKTNNSFNLYPNPARNYVIVEGAVTGINSRIELYNNLGKKIVTQFLNSNISQIDLSGFDQGIYFFRIIDGNNVLQTGKLIKE